MTESNNKQPELTLSALLTQRCTNFANSDKAVEIIDQGIEKMFKDLVGDAFRSYGDFGKLLNEAFKAALPTNISKVVDLPSYNSMVINSVREQWAASGIQSDMQQRVLELVKEFTTDEAVPKFVMASDLWKAFIKDNSEKAAEEQWERPQVFYEESEDMDGYFRIGLHPEPASSGRYGRSIDNAYRCDFYLAFSPQQVREERKTTQLMHEGHPVYELYSGHVGSDTLGKKVISAYSRFDKLIQALYYGGSFLVMDEIPDADELTYPHYDY
ncbi:Uncharacterised protein [Serratia quinivorans]|uniref:hypothetical protein n=1 Tax=Serratia quinivorans TaxID=137545 RepID=UPI002178D507|nr:hypothetical protein [Serratia quinivorans]CAI1621873.1 Uncharacterised protein [Serratia quinivorans]CAI2395328.1 Uncharacterised protein [Serratia quinivorans]